MGSFARIRQDQQARARESPTSLACLLGSNETVAKLFGNTPRLRTQRNFRHVVFKTVCTTLSLRTASDARVSAVGSHILHEP